MLVESMPTFKGSVARLAVEGWGMRSPEDAAPEHPPTERSIATLTVGRSMRGRFSFVLPQSVVAVESSIAEYATGVHSIKIVANMARISETRWTSQVRRGGGEPTCHSF